MRILLTGCTGFVGKFVLRELLEKVPEADIVCLLRGKKGLPAESRWASIKIDSIYRFSNLSKVSIKEGDLEHLDSITWDQGQAPDMIIHCAANVKTLDTYENLYRDNVLGVENLCQVALKWQPDGKRIQILFISTCYVHPKGTVGKAKLLTKGLPRTIFTTDYTYTKYLGEDVAASYSDRLQISLLRLSCVGAPCTWLDAHPTPEAMAHLGIISLILRGRLEYARVPSTMHLSTIPVDIVARSIVDEVLLDLDLNHPEPRVKQICAPPDSIWNLSMTKICKTIQALSPNIKLKVYDSSQVEFENQLKSEIGYWAYTPWGTKSLIFHQEINRFIDKFADGQLFESTVPSEYFPPVSNSDQIYEQTCLYVARGNHQHILEKGTSKSNLDYFWGQMPEHHIQAQFMFREPVAFKTKAAAEERIYSVFSSYRPFFTDPDSKAAKYDGHAGPLIGWTFEEATRESRAAQIEIMGSSEAVTGIKIILHHAVGDGIAYIKHVLPRLDSIANDIPQQTADSPTLKPRSLSMTEELWCFIFYFALLVKLIFSPPLSKSISEGRTVEMGTAKIHKEPGKSFTTSLLKQTYPALRSALGRDTVVYCIPAAIEGPSQRGLSMPRNSFVPIILPWSLDGGTIQEQLLNSKAVKAVSSLLAHFVSLTEFTPLRDYFLDRVDVVFSSLLGSDAPLHLIKTSHFLSPTPKQIPFSICAGTTGSETHITIASSVEASPASKLLSQILRV